MNKILTKEEDEFLRENYNKISLNKLSDKMKRSILAIQNRATMIGVKRTNIAEYKIWTDEERELLWSVCEGLSAREIQEKYFPDRTICSIKGALRRKERKNCNEKAHTTWSDDEISILKEMYPFTPNNELSDLLQRSKDSIVCAAKKLGLKKDYYFTNEELKFIEDNYNKMSDHDIARVVGHNWRVVKDRRLRMGLKHSDIILNAGYRDLANFLRKKTENWRKQSMAWCNYRCVVTGKRFDVVHHLYSVNTIIQELIEEYDIPQNINPNTYDPQELDNILMLFSQKQSKYGLGICLTNEIHKMFHFEYGYGDNTPEQFKEFCKKHNFKLSVDITQN